jgi:SWI/SNF-related matrix-associated actin-dependent regulator of chromatin subfamily D
MRIWVSNTVEDQEWQGDGLIVDAYDFSTNSNASYKVKIEGRLLDEGEEDDSDEESDEEENPDAMDEDEKEKNKLKRDNPFQRSRFSHFFKSMTVDFEKNRSKDGAEQIVEWKKPTISPNTRTLPAAADFDMLEFKRGGDYNQNITINLVPDEPQERFALSRPLAEVMDATEATRAEAVTGIWEYIQIMGLQEDDERRSFRCDDLLKQVRPIVLAYMDFLILTSPRFSKVANLDISHTSRMPSYPI